MFEYGYYYYGGDSGLGIGLSLLDSFVKKYTKKYVKYEASSTNASYTYYYSSSSGIGLININTYLKSFKRISSSYPVYYYYGGDGSSYGIGLSLLNNF